MPAPKGGTPRKGRLAKKAQLDKLVEASKKEPLKNSEKTPPKKSKASKHALAAAQVSQTGSREKDTLTSTAENNLTRAPDTRLAIGKPNIDVAKLDQIPRPPEILAESIPQFEESGVRIATIRLSCQPLKFFPTKRTIPNRQSMQFAIHVPTAIKNPNHVVVRLPSGQKSGSTNFLSLPQEIRNQIYEYALPRNKFRLQWIPRTDQRPTELTYTLPLRDHKGPNLTAKTGQRRRDFDLPKRAFIDKIMPRYYLSPGPAALLLVSRQVNLDTAQMFYGRNTFSFAAMKPLRKFLDNLRPGTPSMIRSLELIHSTASNAEKREHQVMKYRHDRCWETLCFQIRNRCDRLEDLTLDLYIKDLPFKMGPHAAWMSPLYAFMGLKTLKHIDVRLHQFEADEAVLAVEAYTIRKALMCDNFYEPRFNTGNKPILEKPSPRKAQPGVNALRVTVGNRRVPASCIKPSLGPRATVFWSPPTPIQSERSRERGLLTNTHNAKGKGKDVSKPPLTWNPPETLVGTAITGASKGEGKAFRKFGSLINSSLKGKGNVLEEKADAKTKVDNQEKRTVTQNASTPYRGRFRRTRKAVN